jgi:hypothetical protein
MEVASMLKSKDALVPFRHFNFGNKWSLTAMEKATGLPPLQAGFMPNSPMPMLDARNWLLLATVLTSGGGMTTGNQEYLSQGYLTDYESARIFIHTYIH